MEDLDNTASSTGCSIIKRATNLDVSSLSCNSKNCPNCFLFKGPNAITLTLTGCSNGYVGLHNKLGDTGTFWEESIVKYTFINALSDEEGASVTIVDGMGFSKELSNQMAATGYCLQTSGINDHKLYWDAIVTTPTR